MSMVDLCLQATDARASRHRLVKRLMVLAVGLAVATSATAFGLSGAAAQGSTIVVTTSEDGTEADDGIACPASGDDECSLRQAVGTAADGDTITFASGVDPVLESAISIPKTIIVSGNVDGDGNPGTTISGDDGDGDYEDRLLAMEGGSDVVLENLVLTGGNLRGDNGLGGAVLSLGQLTVRNSLFVDNAVGVTTGGGGAIASSGTLIVEDSAFSGNDAFGSTIDDSAAGGAIAVIDQGDATVARSTFTGNRASRAGGAISVLNATIVIEDSSFGGSGAGESNIGRVGGAVSIGSDETGDFTAAGSIIRSTFRGNVAESLGTATSGRVGGAINVSIADVEVIDSTIVDNEADVHGGGINVFASTADVDGRVSVSGTLISGNTANLDGGGIYADTGVVVVANSTVSGNAAGRFGGGVNLIGTPPSGTGSTITHATIVGNSATGTVGVPAGGLQIDAWATASIDHSIIAGSQGADCNVEDAPGFEGTLTSEGYNLDSDGTCALDATDLTGDPLLGPLADNGGPTLTHLPLEGSPAIEGGLHLTCVLSEDQRGLPRPGVGTAACDIGAVEVQGQIDDVGDDPVTPVDPGDEPGEPGDEPREPGDEPAESVDEAETLPESGPAVPVKAQPDFTG